MRRKTIGNLIHLVVLAAASSAFAGVSYWKGGEGNWTDEAMWGTPPTDSVDAYFAHGDGFSPSGERASVVHVTGSQYVKRILLGEFNAGWTGVRGSWDTCPVTFKGPGTLYVNDRLTQGSDSGRDIHFEDISVVQTNFLGASGDRGKFSINGHSIWKNSSLTAPESSFTFESDSAVVLDDVSFDLYRLGTATSGMLTFKSGEMDIRGVVGGAMMYRPCADIRDGRIRAHLSASCYDKTWFPTGTNGLLFIAGADGADVFMPTLAKDDRVCLRGKIATTNSVVNCTAVTFTNDCAVYGRGTINAGFVTVRPGSKVAFDVDKLELVLRVREDGTRIADDATDCRFLNGVTFRGYDTRTNKSTSYPKIGFRCKFFGNVVFDAWDIYRDIPLTFDMSSGRYFSMQERSGVEFKRGTVWGAYYRRPVRFANYIVRDGVTVVERDSSWSIGTDIKIHDMKVGANANLTGGAWNLLFDVNGELDIDPTATLNLPIAPASDTTHIFPVFISLADEKPACTVNYTKLAEKTGYSVRWVGGTAYCSDDKATYGTGDGCWTGATSGYWSDTSNWGNQKMPTAGDVRATFACETRTVVTNDSDTAAARLIYVNTGAPYILRGKAVTLSCTDCWPKTSAATIISTSPFPFISEAPIVTTGATLGLTTQCGGLTSGKNNPRGQIVLKGGFSFDAAKQPTPGKFVPSGYITLGGTSVCGDLQLCESLVEYYNAYQSGSEREYTRRSELTLLKGASLTVQNQTTVNSATSSIWIAKGAVMKVSGSWNWTTAGNEHQVNGLLDLDATVGGSATQGYFGSGVLKVKATDGTDGASMRLGEGLTLVPTAAAWGTMPIDMTSDLTISNATDWTYAVPGGLAVSGTGHRLTVDGAGRTTFETAITGYDYDLCKKGEGTLVLEANADGLARGTLDLQAGTVVFKNPQTIGRWASKSGAAISIGSTDGAVAALTVNDDVDLDGVNFKLADDATRTLLKKKSYTPIVTVPFGFGITGTPTFDRGVRARILPGANGTTVLEAKAVSGLAILLR